MNVISSNLANAQTTRTPGGGPYKRQDVVFGAFPLQNSFQEVFRNARHRAVTEVRVVEIVNEGGPTKMLYNPNHPDADDAGFVAMPNVNVVEEMVNMLSATRSYEANVTAIQAAKGMALKALEIAR
jgi:flagellar basal-body rod protein FlgC